MKICKQLRNEDKQLLAYINIPATLMAKKPRETEY